MPSMTQQKFTRNKIYKMNLLYCYLQEIKSLETIDQVEAFFLKHGENIVDLLGAEIDRVEKELKVKISKLIDLMSQINVCFV